MDIINTLADTLPSKRTGAGQKGQAILEYVFILILVAVVVIVILSELGPSIGGVFSTIEENLNPGPGEEPPPAPPPDCYGSLLLSIMVGLMGLVMALAVWWPPGEAPAEPVPVETTPQGRSARS